MICIDQWQLIIVPVGELWEPPDIANTHAEPDTGEDELPLGSPVLSGIVTALRVRLRESWKTENNIIRL